MPKRLPQQTEKLRRIAVLTAIHKASSPPPLAKVAEIVSEGNTGLSRHGCYEVMRKLETQGLVNHASYKEPSTIGRPINVYSLTEKGKQFLSSLPPAPKPGPV